MKILGTKLNKAKIAIVGDIMLDKYWSGDTLRISPEAPVPVVTIKNQENRAGGAGNVALNISSLNGQAEIFSIVGEDEAGNNVQEILSTNNVQCHFQIEPKLPTPIKLRILSRHQQLLRTDFEQNFFDTNKTELLSSFKSKLPDYNAVILSDYGKGVLSQPEDFIKLCVASNKPVLIDPKGVDFSRYFGASLITPNRNEFELVVGKSKTFAEMAEKAKKLLQQNHIGAILITLSEDGMVLVNNDDNFLHVATKAKEVFDVTGAGDTVIATFATAIASDYDYSQAMEIANLAAGIVVGKLGASTVSQHELYLALLNQQETDKICTVDKLKSIVESLPEVVMTNGCFDLLHAGHVSYLKAAKALGKKLIVAVNTDESVQRLKGKDRPVQKLEQRMEVLAALESVDYVVAFNEDTPEKLYCEILPDILVKGGDYQAQELAGAKCVQLAGGEVRVLHFVEGQSSSKIIKKIKELS